MSEPRKPGALAVAFGWSGVAVLYLVFGAIGLLGVVLTRDTWDKAERDRVEALTAAEPLPEVHGAAGDR